MHPTDCAKNEAVVYLLRLGVLAFNCGRAVRFMNDVNREWLHL